MAKFTEEDIRLLTKGQETRERLLNNFIGKDLPKDTEGIKAARELLDSIDKSIYTKARLKLDEDLGKVSEKEKEMLRELVMTIHSVPTSQVKQETVAPVFQPTQTDFVEGELTDGKDHIDPEPWLT